jgi:hypothetical protein
LTIRRAPFALYVVEKRPLMIELLSCRAALGTDIRQARGDDKALGARRLCRPRTRIGFNLLALDASALRDIVIGSVYRKCCRQQPHQHKPR